MAREPEVGAALPTVTTFGTICMGKIRRGGYVFRTWRGDHFPRHVHIYRDRELVVKWDLERARPMKGEASRRIRKLITELENEGLL